MKIETLSVNGFNIELPIGLEEVMDTPVRDSYQTFLKESTNDVRRHLTCLTTLLPPAVGLKSSRILHAFGGVGASAQVLDQVAPHHEHVFWERDPVLVRYLRHCYPDETVVHAQDSMPWLATEDLSLYDIILLDMSVGTIKTKGVKDMWTNVAKAVKARPGIVVWFTDTACHKIHLNYKTYAKDFGIEIDKTAESYLNAYSAWLEQVHGLTITAAMREAGEFYCVVKSNVPEDNQRFKSIPYV
jgi:hypothetical protein